MEIVWFVCYAEAQCSSRLNGQSHEQQKQQQVLMILINSKSLSAKTATEIY